MLFSVLCSKYKYRTPMWHVMTYNITRIHIGTCPTPTSKLSKQICRVRVIIGAHVFKIQIL